LIALGTLLVLLGLLWWVRPVDHTTAAPDTAKCTTLEDCFVKVDDAPEILLSTIVVFGVLLLVIGINDRKIIKLTGPGDTGFETQAPETGEKAQEKTAQKAADVGLTPALVETAKALADAEARASALEHELAFHRPLSTIEKETIAEDAATIGVSGGGNPDFE
jgi:hypothetical protein